MQGRRRLRRVHTGWGRRSSQTDAPRTANKQTKNGRFRKLATHQLGMTALRLKLRGAAGHRGGGNGEFLSRGSSQGGRNTRCKTRAYAGPRRSPPTRRTKRRPRMGRFSPISVARASRLGGLARARKSGRARAMRPAIGPLQLRTGPAQPYTGGRGGGGQVRSSWNESQTLPLRPRRRGQRGLTWLDVSSRGRPRVRS